MTVEADLQEPSPDIHIPLHFVVQALMDEKNRAADEHAAQIKAMNDSRVLLSSLVAMRTAEKQALEAENADLAARLAEATEKRTSSKK